ncbi:origin recognition complex subunit 4 [Parastagonospora nodorum]|uniref:Origin recognition complex subunit 4 n=1 Tax=Phaeosphaeria nodorum (strain SN15 / ATCC MYA-4574 / FGSC 10173) TaxID=321614 RepID=A0A7U2IBE9_PHANO|nr:origin recognition complex subunit 4 [Parastagonospora nodorum]QRD06759.1 origin recognition complex subunit 4 [Parastagonospora nodorum SN15]KAH3927302.1 origin recognition complex subunit 4 [Parastagonospora nodorum]KAH3952033.1 origin recognition complex subunit 4 [Parastagonospora nodorum]KAH3981707.1 origin recognition complex subunit 4 [Parastagonospora nodorum]
MDDSPRSSKRRKLDTPKRIASSPLVKGSAKRASGRLANRSTSYAAGSTGEGTETERPAKKATNGTTTKRTAVPDIDIYDDIEGALSVAPALRSAPRRSLAASRQGTESTTDELQEVATTPKRGRGRPRASEVTIASKRGKVAKTPAASARKPSAPKSSARRRAVSSEASQEEGTEDPEAPDTPTQPSTRKSATGANKKALVEEEDEDELAGATPSRSSKKRKPLEKRTTIPETEDELDARPPRSSRKLKQTASARRRSNRTDHISNGHNGVDTGDGVKSDDDDEGAMDIDGNSVMESILDPTEPSPFNKPNSAQKKAAAPLIYGNLPAGRELDLLKTIILERIAAKRPTPLVNLDAEYTSVHQIVEQTVTAGEGNSMLLIGARGSGKTALVNKVLSEVAKENAGEYHVVRLNGFIHTDDKIALREIWRQLGKEMDIEDDGSGPGKNYADTLTTLLALLSHPSEHTGEYTDQVAKAVIFVIDEFDLFAQHPRQTLLYNLFDIAQSRKAPIAVLGLTTRIDVTNSLEKRVKSRFSHRYVHLSLAKTFTAFQEMCKAGLIIEPGHLSVEERGILEGGAKSLQTNGTPAKKANKDAKQDILAEWNTNVNKLFASAPFLTQHLAQHFYRTKSIPAVLYTFFLPTATLSPDLPFAPNNGLVLPDSKLYLIPNLSTLALSLLISAARLDIIHDSDTCNFNMAYDEYVTLASKARIQSAAGGMSASGSISKVWGKDVARREWETLVELGLIMPVIQGQTGGFGMIRCDVALEEIGAVLNGEKGVDRYLERWCKAI